MRLVGPMPGEVSEVWLFVAALPFGRHSCVEPTLDMRQDAWLRCHVHALAFFRGCTPIIVPDNLLTGVRRHPGEGGVVPSEACRELAARHGAAVPPARARHPRDKPSAESEVWCATTHVIGALRGRASPAWASPGQPWRGAWGGTTRPPSRGARGRGSRAS